VYEHSSERFHFDATFLYEGVLFAEQAHLMEEPVATKDTHLSYDFDELMKKRILARETKKNARPETKERGIPVEEK